MLKIENARVFGIADALRAMRNPLNSWNKNDSVIKIDPETGSAVSVNLGPNDLSLCKRLAAGGQPHRKYLRQISVSLDITAPSYWWAEMDTYKVATTRNSCSLQHKGDSRNFIMSDFTINPLDQITADDLDSGMNIEAAKDLVTIMNIVNKWRNRYVDGNKSNYGLFRVMRQLLPMGYNYKATWNGNYESLMNIHFWRQHHKLIEWRVFCSEIETLPMMNILLNKETVCSKNEATDSK